MDILSPQKKSRIEGGLVNEEALASSTSVFQRSRGAAGTVKGFQQFFTPLRISALVAAVLGYSSPVIDTTAGTGGMLQAFDRSMRFGIEIDPDATEAPPYTAIPGDAQRVVPMLRAAGTRFPSVAINPPFGMKWQDPAHKLAESNSTLLAFMWALDLMTDIGQGAMLCGTTRLKQEVLRLPEAQQSIYAIVDIQDNVWPDVDLPCSVAFFTQARNSANHYRGTPNPPIETRAFDMSEIMDATDFVKEARSLRGSRVVRDGRNYFLDEVAGKFKAVKNEHERRRAHAAGIRAARSPYDLALKGTTIKSHPAAYAQIMLNNSGRLREIQMIAGQHVNYFASNSKTWRIAVEEEAAGHITIAPNLKEKVAEVIAGADLLATPLFPLKEQMRLGWLTDLESIDCVENDPKRGLVAGKSYPISTRQLLLVESFQRLREKKGGEPELRDFKEERKVLDVTVTTSLGEQKFSETKPDILYMMKHFDMPDPGSVIDRYPAEVKRMRDTLVSIQEENGFRLKEFQLDHCSRLLTKKRGLLAHEQGLGKTLQMMALAEATVRAHGAEDKVLFVCPQDLIPQWKREAKKFFGRELVEIRSPEDAIRVARDLEKPGASGWYITYYECLSLVGKKFETLPHVDLRPSDGLKRRLKLFKEAKKAKKNNGVEYSVGALQITGRPPEEDKPGSASRRSQEEEGGDEADEAFTSAWACPMCFNDTMNGWTGEVCRRGRDFHGCGYVHRRLRKKPAYRFLTHAFRRGVMCVDELSEIRGDSQRSRALRALNRGPFKYGGTGTPVSNYINDAFWGLWWTMGNASPAFPYAYEGGKAKFEKDFCVTEYLMGRRENGEGHKVQATKVLPQVTNVSQFWRLTQPSVSRCRKEATNEPLVDRNYKVIRTPMGVSQKKAHDFWLMNFANYFTAMNPEHNLVRWGLVERFEAMLGQRWKLEFAATMPSADDATKEWGPAIETVGEPSAYTPATLKVMEIAIEHAKEGEKVLIGSDLIAPGKWLSDRFNEKGVKSVHLTEEKHGKTATKNPKKRASEVTEFVEGDASIMCAGVNAMKLGHNLDVASVVIVHGLPDSFMAMDQFLARVHRLTSKKPVTVYVILPKGSLAETKWQLLKDKGGAADLAFDGELSFQNEEAVDWNKILREMKKRGIRGADDEVLEADVEAEWNKVPYIGPQLSAPQAAPKLQPRPDDAKTTNPKVKEILRKASARWEKEDRAKTAGSSGDELEPKRKKKQATASLFGTPIEDIGTYVQDSLFG